MSVPPDSEISADLSRAWRVYLLDLPPAASRAGVHVARIDFDWRVPLASPAYAALSDAERARAARYLRHEDAVRSAATRAALRDVLGTALDLAPSEIAIVVDASGRPSLDSSHRASLDFNVSHAGDHALIAWAGTGRVGVDIESCNRTTDWRALTAEVCAAAEAAYLDGLPPGVRADAFMRVWSAKEALLKALVDGVLVQLMKSGEINALYDKWFMKPVPPKGLAFDFPMSDAIKARYAAPNDVPLE